MSKKRDDLMPLMSIVGIVLVVLGHSGKYCLDVWCGVVCSNNC